MAVAFASAEEHQQEQSQVIPSQPQDMMYMVDNKVNVNSRAFEVEEERAFEHFQQESMNQMMAQQEGFMYTPQEYQPTQPAYDEQMMYQQYQQGISNIISEKTLYLEDIQPIKYK